MIKRGSSRLVILVGRWAVKLPWLHWCGSCYPSCFSRFLFGLYGNSVEATRWKAELHNRSRMARVLCGGALLLVMERCQPVADGESLKGFDGILNEQEVAPWNFGKTDDGRIVAVDYAFW